MLQEQHNEPNSKEENNGKADVAPGDGHGDGLGRDPALEPEPPRADGTTASDDGSVEPPRPLVGPSENPNKDAKNADTGDARTGRSAAGLSERKLAANRANAQKSTGPRTPRGKANSCYNALTHGLTAKKVMLAADGSLDPGMKQLLDSLRERYGSDNVFTELLYEATLADYWRSAKGLEYELKRLGPGGFGFYPEKAMESLQRYVTANRNALLHELKLLEEHREEQGDGQLEDEDSAEHSGDDDELPVS